MTILFVMFPTIFFILGLVLWALRWSFQRNQYEDLEGAAQRILYDD